jgi:hypothetical protein
MVANPYETPEPVYVNDVDTGFTSWGTTSSGVEVISMNNPSTYDWWEWW